MRGKDWVGRSHRFCRACCLRQKPKLLLLPLAAGQAPCVPVNNSNKEASQAGLQGLGIDLMLRFSVCVFVSAGIKPQNLSQSLEWRTP